MERRVIHVFSLLMHGFDTQDKPRDYSFYDAMWHSRLARHIQAASDEYVQECWGIASISKEIAWEDNGISMRVSTESCFARTTGFAALSWSFFLQYALGTARNKGGPYDRATPRLCSFAAESRP
jgi:hypothetical protein